MKKIHRIYWPSVTVLVMLAIVLIARYWHTVDFSVLRAYLCEQNRCTAQDWLSATSGLLGGAAAAVGAYLVFGQLREQRRQTAFALGESHPTLEISVTADLGRRAQFELVNWNRRRVTVENISISKIGEEVPFPWAYIFQHSEAQGHTVVRLTTGYSMSQYINVGGWLDRQKAPNSLRFSIAFRQGDEDHTDLIRSLRGTIPRPLITVHYMIDNQRYTLHQDLNIMNLLPHRRFQFVLV
ncbi:MULTISPECIES: hypothetical protein [unclassified Agrobacterium]|uniref:hypothetical protein n=1 Tax=unclassified Agrobacterium TaxID=2632611 RepID=UPI002448ED9D|nr:MULTISPECIES: hypothetical protein [unclassified Agrobacterium]MDH0613434.1 hypothetical protein [Agrobacterium sp. GD03872]MDH0697351.1 hypothetical protein [Agrobacterium sp. GD03871]MDH1060874.1 hypothetical protein [Agrobacterium sp. GD03992]MDH2211458.1 hypothetical protein [Agrobacterium sp. GD03643]MDH2220717.1 hypothetical protein [Agrobacterium sp. GD03638]